MRDPESLDWISGLGMLATFAVLLLLAIRVCSWVWESIG